MNFCAASWRQRARDRFLGWSPNARVANLDRVVNNQRLLILTRVRVWGLASSVLREAVRRLPEDWRCAPETRALAVQDMSSLNHGSHGATEGLASIGRNGKATANGLRIHVGLAVTEAGRSLGLFEPNADDRGKLDNESRRWLQGMDRAREVAEACPNTRVITVCDQEGDFRDLLLKADSERQGLRVRARRRHARWILVRDQLLDLWEWMALRLPLERRTLKRSARRAADAITARHLFDLARRAREHPEHTARALASQDEIDTLRWMLEEIGTPWARSPPRQNPDIRTFVIGPGRIAGFQPSKRQPLPGVQKVWQANRTLKLVCRGVPCKKHNNIDD